MTATLSPRKREQLRRARISAALRGRKLSTLHCKRISKGNTGKNVPQTVRRRISAALLARHSKRSTETLKPIDPTDLGWLAGLLEGEGCFALTGGHSTSGRCSIGIVCQMTDKDILQRVQQLTGLGRNLTYGRTRPAHWKRLWRWATSGRNAYVLMLLLRPHMGKRRTRKIDQLIRWYRKHKLRNRS